MNPDHPVRNRRGAPVLLLAFLIVVTGAFAYAPSFSGVFVLDDVRAIVQNPTIRTLWPPSTPLAPPSASTVAGRPVANLSFAISYALAPAPLPDATAFHLGNLLIHLAAALVLFGVVRRTLLSPSLHKYGNALVRSGLSNEEATAAHAIERGTGPSLRLDAPGQPLRSGLEAAAPWLALVVALVWVVHPLQTAAVTYVVQRVESLMGLFYLLTLYCAIRASGDTHTRAWTAAAIVCCGLGMATKEVMVTAPIMVALWDHVFGRPRANGGGRVRLRLVIGLAATWAILGALVAYEHRGPSISLTLATSWVYLLTQAGVVIHYLRLAFVPSPLVFLYDWPLASSLAAVAWQAIVLTALVAVTAVGVVRRHPLGFLGAWFFLVLAPSSSVLPILTEVAAEHRMYLPLAAVIAIVAAGLYAAGTTIVRSPRRAAVAGAVTAVAVVAVVAALGVETYTRNRVYASAERLWRDTVDKRPSDARPRVAYADALAGADRLAEAEAQLQTAVVLAPADPVARVRLGAVLARQQKLDDAILQLAQALTLRPGDVDAHRFLAELYAIRRQDGLAVQHFEHALAVLPNDAELLARLASILADSRDATVRDGARALALAARAVSLTSEREPRMLEILSVAQAATGRFADAASTARTALAIARSRGDRALAWSLEYRASAYESAARDPFGPRR
jgi:tetratricopeptide (TPR) repeat protein